MQEKNQLVEFWKENFHFREREVDAFKKVDRKEFIPKVMQAHAYEDIPLPLMRGKTISQPTTVMIMTAALELKEGDKVFELGTGSGYQSAIIAKIIGKKGKVISTEVMPELVQFAKENLAKAKMKNVSVYEEDGSKGMPSEAPFDKIIITAACKEFPDQLIDQLRIGGIIIGPVGSREEQTMVRGIKERDQALHLEFLGPFLFTPMYGKYGFEI